MGKGVPWARRVQLSLQPRYPLPPYALHPPYFTLAFLQSPRFLALNISDTRLSFSVIDFEKIGIMNEQFG